jgi:hypothetical protein
VRYRVWGNTPMSRLAGRIDAATGWASPITGAVQQTAVFGLSRR